MPASSVSLNEESALKARIREEGHRRVIGDDEEARDEEYTSNSFESMNKRWSKASGVLVICATSPTLIRFPTLFVAGQPFFFPLSAGATVGDCFIRIERYYRGSISGKLAVPASGRLLEISLERRRVTGKLSSLIDSSPRIELPHFPFFPSRNFSFPFRSDTTVRRLRADRRGSSEPYAVRACGPFPFARILGVEKEDGPKSVDDC